MSTSSRSLAPTAACLSTSFAVSSLSGWSSDRESGFVDSRGAICSKSYRPTEGLEARPALVSDYPASSKLKALGLESAFDTVVSNGEPSGPSRLKPAPDGFLLAAERLGVAPQECLVIGDRKDADGLAASRAGMALSADRLRQSFARALARACGRAP